MATQRRSAHLYFLMMILAALWALAGAPLLPEEWAALPEAALRMLRQLPRRMLSVLACWFA